MKNERIRSIYASNEELKLSVAGMSTAAVANLMQNLAEERRNLQGKIANNPINKRANEAYKRLIRICSKELNHRQMEMF